MISEKTIYVLDSGVFLSGAANAFLDKPCATTYGVVSEMKSGKASMEIDRAVLGGLAVLEPSKDGASEAEAARQKTQDKLSGTDMSIIALALDFKKKGKAVAVVSDDYGVQNLSRAMKLEFVPISNEGIKKGIEWTGRCRGCGHKTNEKTCPNCGSAVKFGARVTN